MEISNNDNNEVAPKPKKYATDEAGMMADAKIYAKQDFKSVVDTLKKLGTKVVSEDRDLVDGEIREEAVAKALILVKFDQIKESRLNRTSYFD